MKGKLMKTAFVTQVLALLFVLGSVPAFAVELGAGTTTTGQEFTVTEEVQPILFEVRANGQFVLRGKVIARDKRAATVIRKSLNADKAGSVMWVGK
jgi:hypothetical protein